jgi:GntR family transcriptional regulator/MocR family aminotransferase
LACHSANLLSFYWANKDLVVIDFHIGLDARGDRTARIYQTLKSGMLDGRLRPGDRLPPSRELARNLQVSRNTVATAYERLVAEGFLTGRVGDGTFVAGSVPSASRATGRRGPHSHAASDRPVTRRAAKGDLRPRPGWTFVPRPLSWHPEVPRYDFRIGVPDAHLFPYDVWRRLINHELRLTANSPGSYAEPSGHPALREAIARQVGYSRSVHAGPDDVIVTNGAQQALDLIGRVLITPGAVVAIEEPGYPPAHDLFASLGARVVGVPVDAEGVVVDRLPANARLVYTTPSHQFPLGTAMSLARRMSLLAWAGSRNAAIVEDDYDSEFRFSQRPLEPLQSLDTGGRVLYVGSFSKTMLPTLRVGFVIAPTSLRQELAAARQLSDWHGQAATQAALARFMDEGLLARHIHRSSRAYGVRRASIVETIEQDLGEWLALAPSSAGLHVCTWLRSGDLAVVDAVIDRAREDGIAVEPLAAYCNERPAQAGFVFGYGAIPSDRVQEGLSRFGAALRREVALVATERG